MVGNWAIWLDFLLFQSARPGQLSLYGDQNLWLPSGNLVFSIATPPKKGNVQRHRTPAGCKPVLVGSSLSSTGFSLVLGNIYIHISYYILYPIEEINIQPCIHVLARWFHMRPSIASFDLSAPSQGPWAFLKEGSAYVCCLGGKD